jgi:hypothetical protein
MGVLDVNLVRPDAPYQLLTAAKTYDHPTCSTACRPSGSSNNSARRSPTAATTATTAQVACRLALAQHLCVSSMQNMQKHTGEPSGSCPEGTRTQRFQLTCK